MHEWVWVSVVCNLFTCCMSLCGWLFMLCVSGYVMYICAWTRVWSVCFYTMELARSVFFSRYLCVPMCEMCLFLPLWVLGYVSLCVWILCDYVRYICVVDLDMCLNGCVLVYLYLFLYCIHSLARGPLESWVGGSWVPTGGPLLTATGFHRKRPLVYSASYLALV